MSTYEPQPSHDPATEMCKNPYCKPCYDHYGIHDRFWDEEREEMKECCKQNFLEFLAEEPHAHGKPDDLHVGMLLMQIKDCWVCGYEASGFSTMGIRCKGPTCPYVWSIPVGLCERHWEEDGFAAVGGHFKLSEFFEMVGYETVEPRKEEADAH